MAQTHFSHSTMHHNIQAYELHKVKVFVDLLSCNELKIKELNTIKSLYSHN